MPGPAHRRHIFDSSEQKKTVKMDSDVTVTGRSVFVAGFIVLTAIIFFSNVPQMLNTPLKSDTQDLYSVVFDAGSTGSRVFVFHFKVRDQAGGLSVRLDEEIFLSVEPGISSYSKNPPEAAQSLVPLLNKAISSVPTQYQPDTLITLKATAGLRLLPSSKAERIVDEIKTLMVSSPFYLPDPNKIEIMSGQEEGLFGWVTVNYILDLFWDEDLDNTVTTFDLGGGSMQVSFEIAEKTYKGDFRLGDVCKLRLLHADFTVFTHSYLGYGLKSGRLGILGGKEEADGTVIYDTDVTDKVDSNDVTLYSPCFYSGENITFTHGDVEYVIKGTNKMSDLRNGCEETVEEFVKSAHFIRSKELSRREIHLFSYFYDVAVWAGMIPATEMQRQLTPHDFYQAAEKYCRKGSSSSKFPFLCVDLLYINKILTTGIGLSPDNILLVEKRLLGKEVSWSLGAALSTLSDDFSYAPVFQ